MIVIAKHGAVCPQACLLFCNPSQKVVGNPKGDISSIANSDANFKPPTNLRII